MPDLDEVRRLAAQGLSDQEIGDALGVSRETIRRRRASAGITAGTAQREVPPHGTAARYRAVGCRCDECRGARTAEVLAGLRRRQAATAHAPNYGEPWTPEELHALVTLGAVRAARTLPRTYFACLSQYARTKGASTT